MSDRFERAMSTALVAAAVAIAVALMHREFFAQPQPASVAGRSAPRFEEGWKDLLSTGEAVGDTAAPIKVIEFSDLECPFCKTFHKNLREIIASNPKAVVGFFVHYPNEAHRFAFPAARAAECARTRGHFDEFVRIVFLKQDSLGIKSWGSYALEAGLQDTAAISTCALENRVMPRIAAGIALGEKHRIAGTPTVILNGWRIEGSPSKSELTRIIGELQKGKSPFSKAALSGL